MKLTSPSGRTDLRISAGVGLSTDFREMRKQGLYPFIVGAAGEIGSAIGTLGIVLAVQPWLPA